MSGKHRKDVWRSIERIAMILRNEGIISTSAASEICGISLQDLIKKYGIELRE